MGDLRFLLLARWRGHECLYSLNSTRLNSWARKADDCLETWIGFLDLIGNINVTPCNDMEHHVTSCYMMSRYVMPFTRTVSDFKSL